jgi:exopolyphosphatase/pppGpp-phosphohydrolase
VAVVDVGSNSVRLLVASVKRRGVARLGAVGVVGTLDVTPHRAETLLGGTLVLAEVARRLDTKLEIGRGGVREGAALAFALAQSAAA